MIQKGGGAVEIYSDFFNVNGQHSAHIISYNILNCDSSKFESIIVPFESLKEIDAETWQKMCDANKFGL